MEVFSKENFNSVGLHQDFIDEQEGKLSKKDLQLLTIESLMKNGKRNDDACLQVIASLKLLGVYDTDVKQDSKIVNDPIHGHIELHPACLAIIDTPQFQRLRNIKQLGMCYHVYPGAAHNRFEHSLGVCYLAGQFARTLQKNQPYLGITDNDILCVEIAGLCHDLGHGPFSHVFDGLFIPVVRPGHQWKHEQASIDMLDYLIQENKLVLDDEGPLKKYGLNDTDIIFIKEQIFGPLDKTKGLTGREKHKHYLYEIVSNKRNGIDVDKWDYFARDCHHLGIKNNFDHNRFMKFARVIKAKGKDTDKEAEWQICIREKEISNLYNMFYTRYTLHKTAYQHRVTKTIESMIRQVLVKANDDLLFVAQDGRKLKMSECIDDMKAYSQLTDNVLSQIMDSNSDSPNMKEAKEIVQCIFTRKLYPCIYESDPLDPKNFTLKEDGIRDGILKRAEEIDAGNKYVPDDLIVQFVKLDFGMKDENPVEKLLVYSKGAEDEASVLTKTKASRVLGPVNFSELFIRVVSRSPNIDTLKKAARQYVETTINTIEPAE
ncbi:deoxynucleoside triphosphate triphosphohydrolase SAMHD1-like isoform X1 [Biomphalaria glabrata]|uniref:Deoxynucleoside triphosphate triphosphohydrolase SAMHD1-like isoform X1 n=2 Tax=Biomphalaria glabrata TaxID=6526 RepID=A0A9W3AUS8_BIOGL|nr:deoxynucleoside triphosphate triphosphohydrolase SAMHD1-like isoform X1 [Biomphalaria glabrata]